MEEVSNIKMAKETEAIDMFITKWNDTELIFETNEQVFSPMAIDRGTLAMLSVAVFDEKDKVLDLGCGYGPVGILAAKKIGEENVMLCDISEEAIQLAKENAKRNGVEGVKIIKSNGLKDVDEKDFTLILSNPPYHVDFSVPKAFIEDGYKKLAVGGKMLMVTKRKDWYKNKLISVFGGVKIEEIDGYYVFIAEKRISKVSIKKTEEKTNTLSKKLARKVSNKNNKPKK